MWTFLIEPVLLSGFCSVFEISFGLNAALSVWKTASNEAVIRFKKIAKEHVDESIVSKLELSPEGKTVTKLRTDMNNSIKSLNKVISFGKAASIFLAILSAVLLIYSGAVIDEKVAVGLLVLGSFFMLSISPATIFLSKYRCATKLKKFKEDCATAIDNCSEGKDSANKAKAALSEINVDNIRPPPRPRPRPTM